MIVPMKKLCLMVQEKNREKALEVLREVGVVHLEKKDASVDVNSNAHKLKTRVEDAMGLISEYKAPKKKKKPPEPAGRRPPKYDRREKPIGVRRGRRAVDIFGTDDEVPYSIDAVRANARPYLPDLINNLGENRAVLKEQGSALSREVARIKGWGDFNPSKIQEIISYGVPVFLYEISPDDLARLDENVQYIKVKSDKFTARIIVFYEKLSGFTPFQLPEKCLCEYQEELGEKQLALQEIEAKLEGFADRGPALAKEMAIIQQDLDFEVAIASMNNVDEVPPELGVSWLTGYIPNDELEHVKAAAKENGWALTAYDPGADDTPPTKIKSSSFARIIHPLFSFLGTFPGYREFDISPSYLIFFSIFFAMILGDAGYGVLLFTVAVILGFSIKKTKGTFPDLAKLLMVMTFTAVFWGTINGSWFQIPYENLPVFLQVLVIPPFNNMGPVVEFPGFLQNIFKLPAEVPVDVLKTRWNIQFLCFTLAVIQLVWARGKRIKKQLPSLTAFAQLGILLMMLGLYLLVLNMMLGIELPPFAIWLIVGGIVFNLIFAEQNGGNFFANIGKSFGGFFQLFLKAVSCFADIISYMRLFAVGLAGSMIAQIFNNMAIPADGFGSFGIMFIIQVIIMVLILAAGHALNLALTSLSVLVHGVRLNLLEYAGNHLEMEWSGYLYNPFSLKIKQKEN